MSENRPMLDLERGPYPTVDRTRPVHREFFQDHQGHAELGDGQRHARRLLGVPLNRLFLPDGIQAASDRFGSETASPTEAKKQGTKALYTPEIWPKRGRWLAEEYRPRNLTDAGRVVIEGLDPRVFGTSHPLSVGPVDSLDKRLEFLARRYTALDLLMRGHVLEHLGVYLHPSRKGDSSIIDRALALLGDSRTRMEDGDLLAWSGWLRRPSMEQLIALEPEAGLSIILKVDRLRDEGFLAYEPIPIGAGVLEGFSLTKKGWKAAREADPRLIGSGGGPRNLKPQNREFHEQVVGDAVVFFMHENEAMGASIKSIKLEDQIRSESPELATFPDISIASDFGPEKYKIRQEVEVVGLGHSYKPAGVRAKAAAGYIRRVFSHRGNRGMRGGDVFVGR